MLPLPGGLGGIDGGLIGTLIVYGIDPAAAAAAVFAYRIVLFWVPIVMGVPALLSLRGGLNDLSRQDLCLRCSAASNRARAGAGRATGSRAAVAGTSAPPSGRESGRLARVEAREHPGQHQRRRTHRDPRHVVDDVVPAEVDRRDERQHHPPPQRHFSRRESAAGAPRAAR